jgi:hypothetical protein
MLARMFTTTDPPAGTLTGLAGLKEIDHAAQEAGAGCTSTHVSVTAPPEKPGPVDSIILPRGPCEALEKPGLTSFLSPTSLNRSYWLGGCGGWSPTSNGVPLSETTLFKGFNRFFALKFVTTFMPPGGTE